VLGRQPRPGAELVGRREALHLADLGYEDGAQHGTHARYDLDGPIAGVRSQLDGDLGIEGADLPVVEDDQVAQGLDPQAVVVRQLEGIELGRAAEAEHVESAGQDAVLGHDGMNLGFESRAQSHRLGPIAHDLSELSYLGRGDPGLG